MAVGNSQNLGMDLAQLFTNMARWETDLDKNKNVFTRNWILCKANCREHPPAWPESIQTEDPNALFLQDVWKILIGDLRHPI